MNTIFKRKTYKIREALKTELLFRAIWNWRRMGIFATIKAIHSIYKTPVIQIRSGLEIVPFKRVMSRAEIVSLMREGVPNREIKKRAIKEL